MATQAQPATAFGHMWSGPTGGTDHSAQSCPPGGYGNHPGSMPGPSKPSGGDQSSQPRKLSSISDEQRQSASANSTTVVGFVAGQFDIGTGVGVGSGPAGVTVGMTFGGLVGPMAASVVLGDGEALGRGPAHPATTSPTTSDATTRRTMDLPRRLRRMIRCFRDGRSSGPLVDSRSPARRSSPRWLARTRMQRSRTEARACARAVEAPASAG